MMTAPLHPRLVTRRPPSIARPRFPALSPIADARSSTRRARPSEATQSAAPHRALPDPDRSDIWLSCAALWPALVALALATCGVATDALASPTASGATLPAPSAPTTRPGPTTDDEPTTEADDELDHIDPMLASRVHGPPIAEVLAAAYAAAGIDHARANTRGWIRRARLGGLVPWLTVRVGRDASWQTDDPTIDKGMALEVRATWRLDRLVFDGRELQVATIEAARRRERRRLGRIVIRTYFTWIRASLRALGHPTTRSASLAVEEAEAELDALTDGWFSEGLARSRRTASENRTSGLR